MLRIIGPSNIFTSIIRKHIASSNELVFTPKLSGIILSEYLKDDYDIAIIPSMDLITAPDLFVSKEYAIAFEGSLDNSYLYFQPAQSNFSKLLLQGDISKNEILLSKIIFMELYGTDPELSINLQKADFAIGNFLVTGDSNFEKSLFMNGMSFSDQIADYLNALYVNFVAVSGNKDNLVKFNGMMEGIEENLYQTAAGLELLNEIEGLDHNYVTENINTVYYQMTEEENESLTELIRLPFYQGITEEISNIKFV